MRVSANEYQALIIGESNYPHRPLAMEGNSRKMAEMLATQMSDVRLELDVTSFRLRALLQELAATANENTVSFFVYAGHGVNGGAYVINEVSFPYEELKSLLDQVKGKKIVILNCCHAGSFIRELEVGDDSYIVFANSLAQEVSYSLPTGGDLLNAILLGAGGNDGEYRSFRADTNLDSQVSVGELAKWLRSVIFMSTPVTYSLDDDFIITRQRPGDQILGPQISGFKLTASDPDIYNLSFVVESAPLPRQVIIRDDRLQASVGGAAMGYAKIVANFSFPAYAPAEKVSFDIPVERPELKEWQDITISVGFISDNDEETVEGAAKMNYEQFLALYEPPLTPPTPPEVDPPVQEVDSSSGGGGCATAPGGFSWSLVLLVPWLRKKITTI